MVNKKGWGILEWGAVAGIIGVIILIIVYRAELFVFFFGWIITPKPTPSPIDIQPNNQSNQSDQLPFDFFKTEFSELKPIKDDMYKNSTNFVCSYISNPYDTDIKQNFTFAGEWFFDKSLNPNVIWPENLTYNETFNTIRIYWQYVGNYSNVNFRGVIFNDNKKSVHKKIGYELIDNPEFYNYLNKDSLITWNNKIIEEFINKTPLCGLKTDRELAKKTLDFVRSYMVPPPLTVEINSYNNKTLTSEEAWNDKQGTSSEYSVVYVMLLRVIGIPSRILTNPSDIGDYYFVEVYLKDEGWVPVDVYDETKEVGDLFEKELLELNKNYYYITFKELEKVDFIFLNTETPLNRWVSLKGTIRNNVNQHLELLKVDITLLDEKKEKLYSNYTYLIHYMGLGPYNKTSVELNSFPKNLDNIKFVNISKSN